MNRFERYQPARFWKGVAQITRNRDRAFIASLCSLDRFSISSIWRADRCEGSRLAGFPLLDLDPRRIERTKATTRCKNETLGHQLTELPQLQSYRTGNFTLARFDRDSGKDSPAARHHHNDRFRIASDGIAETLILRARNTIPMRAGNSQCA
jgi:hypothetical protein